MMTPLRSLLPALIITLAWGSVAAGQRPVDRLKQGWDDIRPRGELLRKIFGEDEPEADGPAARDPAIGRPVPPRQPTLADPRAALEMQRRQEMAARQQRLLQQQRYQQPLREDAPAGFGTSFVPQPPDRASRPTHAIPPVAGPGSAGRPRHLGLRVVQASDNQDAAGLLIEQVDPQGAGAVAGLRRGDVIVSVGGIEARNEADLTSIAKIMQPGDQVEFEILRRGQPKKILVQFGDVPDGETEMEKGPVRNGRIGDITSPAPVTHIASLNDGVLKSVLVRD